MESIPPVVKGWEPSLEQFKEIVGKAILYREAQRLAVELKIMSFRINIVTYTVALLAHLTARRIDLGKLWDAQTLPEPMRRLVKNWLPGVGAVLVESTQGRNPTEWFKQDGCWKNLRDRARDW